MLEHEKIEVLWNKRVTEVLGYEQITGLRLEDTVTGETRELEVGGLFVAIAHHPAPAFSAGQLELADQGYIVVDEPSTRTSVSGVFAAGDVVDHTYRQAVTAAGMGCKAAIDAEQWLGINAHNW